MSRLCLITALPAESRPLLDTLKLRQAREKHLRLYESERYLLLETGLGKLRSAATTAALLQCRQDIGSVVNIGIAGGRFAYGQSVIAHHVCDEASGAQWYPHLPCAAVFREMASASINTLDAPSTQYRNGVLFDMEAAGIFSAASTYLSTSQIHSVKVVSDNPENGVQAINKAVVNTLLQEAMHKIIPLLDVLEEQPGMQSAQPGTELGQLVEQTCARVHHTINDEIQLRTLLQQHVNLSGHLPAIPTSALTAKDIRNTLGTELSTLPFNYDES